MEYPEILLMYQSIYSKKPLMFLPAYDIGINIMLTKWVAKDKDSIKYIVPLLDYLFYLNPKHYYYLLWLNIPKRDKAPYTDRLQKTKKKAESAVLKKIQEIYWWTDAELQKNKKILEKVIMSNEKYWLNEFGIG